MSEIKGSSSRASYVHDGSEEDGGPAVIQVRGSSAGSRLLTGYLPQLVPTPSDVVTEYRLYPDQDEILVYSWFSREEAALKVNMHDLVVWSDDASLYYHHMESSLIPPSLPFVSACDNGKQPERALAMFKLM